MSSRLSYRVSRLLCALSFVAAAPAVAQEADTLAVADTSAAADTVDVAPLLREDPRLTWLGDTLWSVARSIQPSGDVRPLVDRLADRIGGAGLEVGQRISLEGLAG